MLPESNRKRERFLVEINKKRSANIINEARKQKGLKSNNAVELIDKILAYSKEEHLEELQALTNQFMQEERSSNLDQLVDRAIPQNNPQTFAMLLTILSFAYSDSANITTPKNLYLLLNKCMLALREPWGRVVLEFINTLTKKEEGVCHFLVSSEARLQVLVELSHNKDSFKLLQNIWESISQQISAMFRLSEDSTSIQNVLKALLRIENITNTGIYTKMIKDALQDIDDQELGLNFLERNMGDMHTLCSILKDQSALLLERRRSVAEVLEILFYSEEHVVATLLLSGFGEYIEFMIQDIDFEIQSSGFICLESILLSDNEEILEYVNQTLVALLVRCFEQTFKQDNIVEVKMDLNLMRAVIALIENKEYNSQLSFKHFVWNCGSRLDEQRLYYETLVILTQVIEKQDCWKILQSRDILKKIQSILRANNNQAGVTSLCEKIIQSYDAYIHNDK